MRPKTQKTLLTAVACLVSAANAGGQVDDCNSNGIPDDVEAGNEGAGFDDVASYATFETKYTDPPGAAGGYIGAIFDGRYVYFVPNSGSAQERGEILRYDMQGAFDDPASWATFNTVVSLGARGGYLGGVFDGQYVYFAPHVGATGTFHGEVLRYDTSAEFDQTSSWDTFDAQAQGIGTRWGYYDAVYDGRRVIFIPNYSGAHAEVLVYDKAGSFADPSSWCVLDLEGQGISASSGWWGGVFDGERYVYFAPNDSGPGYQQHGEVLRFDSWMSACDPAAWQTYDPGDNGVGTDPDDYRGVTFDGRYVYFAPARKGADAHGEVLRHDTTGAFDSPASWATYDPAASGVGNDPQGFDGAVFDGRFVYFVPEVNGSSGSDAHGEILRFDTAGVFADTASWDTYDPGDNGLGTDPDWYAGAAFDGQFIYFAPHHNGTEYHGEVLRYDTLAGWSPDCNSNGSPDECDIADGTSYDCNSSGIPDECEIVSIEGWERNPDNGHWYRLTSAETASWHVAEAEALAWGGHLVTIRNADEESWLYGIFSPDNNGFWSGLYQHPDSAEPAAGWGWISGEPLDYTNWCAGEPNNAGGYEHWGEVGYQSSCWNDSTSPTAHIQYGIIERMTAPPTDSNSNGVLDECEEDALCDYLGDSCWPGMRDLDLFTFVGIEGESVTISLDRTDGDDSSDERATLVLMSWPCSSRPCRLLRMDRSALANQVNATLPCEGRYLVLVKEQPWWLPGQPFTGDYCLTMDASGDAASTLEALLLSDGRHASGGAGRPAGSDMSMTWSAGSSQSAPAHAARVQGADWLDVPARVGDDLDLDGDGLLDLTDLEELVATLAEMK